MAIIYLANGNYYSILFYVTYSLISNEYACKGVSGTIPVSLIASFNHTLHDVELDIVTMASSIIPFIDGYYTTQLVVLIVPNSALLKCLNLFNFFGKSFCISLLKCLNLSNRLEMININKSLTHDRKQCYISYHSPNMDLLSIKLFEYLQIYINIISTEAMYIYV